MSSKIGKISAALHGTHLNYFYLEGDLFADGLKCKNERTSNIFKENGENKFILVGKQFGIHADFFFMVHIRHELF